MLLFQFLKEGRLSVAMVMVSLRHADFMGLGLEVWTVLSAVPLSFVTSFGTCGGAIEGAELHPVGPPLCFNRVCVDVLDLG